LQEAGLLPVVTICSYWLPVRYQIEYKIALITFKALTTQQPQYLSELIHHYEAPIDFCNIVVLTTFHGTVQQFLNLLSVLFCPASPAVWNSLPQTVISDLTVTTGMFKEA